MASKLKEIHSSSGRSTTVTVEVTDPQTGKTTTVKRDK